MSILVTWIGLYKREAYYIIIAIEVCIVLCLFSDPGLIMASNVPMELHLAAHSIYSNEREADLQMTVVCLLEQLL